jgi:hypothetical protein
MEVAAGAAAGTGATDANEAMEKTDLARFMPPTLTMGAAAGSNESIVNRIQ